MSLFEVISSCAKIKSVWITFLITSNLRNSNISIWAAFCRYYKVYKKVEIGSDLESIPQQTAVDIYWLTKARKWKDKVTDAKKVTFFKSPIWKKESLRIVVWFKVIRLYETYFWFLEYPISEVSREFFYLNRIKILFQ